MSQFLSTSRELLVLSFKSGDMLGAFGTDNKALSLVGAVFQWSIGTVLKPIV